MKCIKPKASNTDWEFVLQTVQFEKIFTLIQQLTSIMIPENWGKVQSQSFYLDLHLIEMLEEVIN